MKEMKKNVVILNYFFFIIWILLIKKNMIQCKIYATLTRTRSHNGWSWSASSWFWRAWYSELAWSDFGSSSFQRLTTSNSKKITRKFPRSTFLNITKLNSFPSFGPATLPTTERYELLFIYSYSFVWSYK